MASDPKPLSGPDLAAGVPFDQLRDGAPLLGHAGGEAVLLVRRGDEVLACAATCTHYGGPLAEGLVVGETIRCPWHHAAFNLRTGAVDRAPALNPIACFRVQRAGGLIRVAEKTLPSPALMRTGVPASVVIIGAGAAGNAAAEVLRREGYAGPVTIVGAEASVPYDRPNLSKDYLAGNAPEAWIPLRPDEFYAQQQIELVRGVPAQSIDLQGRAVVLEDGRRLSWERLLLATGAEPVRLSVPGAGRPNVRTLRSLADCRQIIAALAPGKRVVIVGSSFIGMEAAAALRARDVAVHVVSPDAAPFERTLGPAVGDFFRTVHVEHGVEFHLGEGVSGIEDQAVVLTGGQRVAADLVLVGIGVRPSVALAERAGLAIDGGVKVDGFLETSAPGVFAAGDVARWPDPRTGRATRVEHWVVAERMGEAAARNMLGARQPFDAVPFFWTTQYDLTLNYIGHGEGWDEVQLDGALEGRDSTIVYRAGGRIVALATVGRDLLNLEAERAFERDDQTALEALVGRR